MSTEPRPRLIEPRTLKGFRDYPPELAIPRERLMETARLVFRSYGFVPIDTPALEYTEILLGKGSEETDRQLFRFEDQGGRDVALRFDLTVPFARFAAQNLGQLGTPFKRYHLAPVWRGESPQRGRFREFIQCDFDTIGTESNAADIETALIIGDLLDALRIERFSVRVNNRLVLNGLLAELDLRERAVEVLRALDKLAKVGPEAVAAEMADRAGATGSQASRILALAAIDGEPAAVLDQLDAEFGGNDQAALGIARLRELIEVTAAAGAPAGRYRIDLSIARGLEYYTGTVYETFLDDLPAIGSVCSGGRYDNLAGLYTRQHLPGVGASLGLDRLLAALEQLGLTGGTSHTAPVLVVQFDRAGLGAYHRIARALRSAGIGAEVYPDPRKLGVQLAYAERRGCRVAVIAGAQELAQGVVQVKDLTARSQHEVIEADLAAHVQRLLAS
jgi:histidyl-tRNA synthetase